MKIFILEDEEMVAAVMEEVLKRLLKDAVIVRARTVADGLATLCESQDFDLAVLDYELPDGFGTELMETLRRKMPRCRVLVVSGVLGTDPDATRLISRQAPDGMLGKPFRVRDFRQKLAGIGVLERE